MLHISTTDRDRRIWALVPTKELARAKTRLAGVLTPEERRALVLAMLGDVLATLSGSPELAGVAVVSRDPSVQALAADWGALLLDDSGGDLNGSLTAGAAQLAARGAGGLLVVPADVPLIAPGDVAALVGALRAEDNLVLAPARDGGGTNGLALMLPSTFAFAFGIDSFARHREQGLRLGLTVAVHRSATLGLDIDTADDLCTLEESSGAPTTHELIRELHFAPCGV